MAGRQRAGAGKRHRRSVQQSPAAYSRGFRHRAFRCANLSAKDTFFGVYTIDDSDANTPSANPLSTVVENLREQVASVEEQHVFSPTLLNTARFGYSRAAYFFTGHVPVDLPGWVVGAPIGAVVIGGGTASNGVSQITLAGANNGSNQVAGRNLFTIDDHVGIMRGRHQITAGFWLQRLQANDNLVQSQFGQALFQQPRDISAGHYRYFFGSAQSHSRGLAAS